MVEVLKVLRGPKSARRDALESSSGQKSIGQMGWLAKAENTDEDPRLAILYDQAR
jgi:hypothetical protein